MSNKEIRTNEGTQTFIANIRTIIFGILAFILLYKGIKGWGWFMFVAIISSCRVSVSDKDEAENE